MATDSASGGGAETAPALSAAARARMERSRLRARALRDARLAAPARALVAPVPALALDSGGGFLLEEWAPRAAPGPAPARAPAPLVDPAERPPCADCARPIATSYLLDTFGHPVCDECRDDEDAHALLPRTEAKSLYLLKDCDLDAREPPLRALRRRNPHGAHAHDMRLYLRAQLECRALAVWGSAEALERERERRRGARAQAERTRAERRLRALRLAARSSLLAGAGAGAPHAHSFGAESFDAAAGLYQRACTSCPHVERYEKM